MDDANAEEDEEDDDSNEDDRLTSSVDRETAEHRIQVLDVWRDSYLILTVSTQSCVLVILYNTLIQYTCTLSVV